MSTEPTSVPQPITKHLRRICPTLAVADARKAAAYYESKLGFEIMYAEGSEFAMIVRDDCRIMLKRGLNEPSATRNRDRCGADFYDLFIHCDSMPAFDALRSEFQQTQPDRLGPIEEWSGMRLFSLYDLDGYKIYFARSV